MDRSTHVLLSASSVTNRLQLVEMSRRRATTTTHSGSASAVSSSTDHDSPRHRSSSQSVSNLSITIPFILVPTIRMPPCSPLFCSRRELSSSHQSLFSNQDMQERWHAMRFIPSVETAEPHCDNGSLPWRGHGADPHFDGLLHPTRRRCLGGDPRNWNAAGSGIFAHDVGSRKDSASDSEVSTRLTLLDLTIQCVCDVATHSASKIL
jgi:hypothetical protein